MHKTQEAQFMKEISFCICKLPQNRGLKNYQSRGNLKQREVNFERGVSTPKDTMYDIVFNSIDSDLFGTF